MGRRTGSADLPLHGGHVPRWLSDRMARLGRVIVEAIVHHYGRDEFLRRLAHPFWFQSFGAVMGMDWHSSGITTSVMGALKHGLVPVVQQGMNPGRRQARRYHWLSEGLESFVEEPHSAIDGPNQGEIVNLTDRRAAASRTFQVELVRGGPDRVLALARKLADMPEVRPTAVPHLQMPAHHDLRPSDVLLRRLHGTLAAAAERGPVDFTDLLLTPGVGARTVATLAMVGEVVHGVPCRFSDPARFSMALGGKDGHPFPVPLRVYDETIRVLREALDRARLGNDDRLAAIRRLDQQARLLERCAEGPAFEEFVRQERESAPLLGGRTVFAPAGRRERPARVVPEKQHRPRQLRLL
jgi:hypothetical protein